MQRALIPAALLVLAACEDAPQRVEPAEPSSSLAPTPITAAEPAKTAAPAPSPKARRPSAKPPRKGEEVQIPAGKMRIGSVPATALRSPPSEADWLEIDVPAFSIDRLPYPNDPDEAPLHSIDRREAARLCKAREQRLCDELEWERACKGDEHDLFPSGDQASFEACRAKPETCSSSFGVSALGVAFREWTASNVTRGLGDSLRTAVVRGGSPDAPLGSHRCAARDSVTPDSKSKSLAFRCCRGDAPKLEYPVEPLTPPYEPANLEPAKLRDILSAVPELANLASSYVPFDASAVDKTLKKGGRSAATLAPWTPVVGALWWSPTHGERVLVITGDAKPGAFVAFLYPWPEGKWTFGGSFELANEHDPVGVATSPDSQRELLWSTCWGCGGEGGAITFRDDARIVIVQR